MASVGQASSLRALLTCTHIPWDKRKPNEGKLARSCVPIPQGGVSFCSDFFFTMQWCSAKRAVANREKEELVFPLGRMRCGKTSPRLQIVAVVVGSQVAILTVVLETLCLSCHTARRSLNWNHFCAQLCIFLSFNETLQLTASLWSSAVSDYVRVACDKDKWCRDYS